MQQLAALYLLSSNANVEYMRDVLEVMGMPRGTVQHFRYRAAWVEKSLWANLPEEHGLLPESLQDSPVLVVYLYQEEVEQGKWQHSCYYPARQAFLRDAHKDGQTAHFYFELGGFVKGSLRPEDIGTFTNEVKQILDNEGRVGKYAFRAQMTLEFTEAADDTIFFQRLVDAIRPEHFRQVRVGRSSQYAPVFLLIHGVYRLPSSRLVSRLMIWILEIAARLPLRISFLRRARTGLAHQMQLIVPKRDDTFHESFYTLDEGESYAVSISTYHSEDSPVPDAHISIYMDTPIGHFLPDSSQRINIGSRYDREVWRLITVPSSSSKWSYVELRKDPVEVTRIERDAESVAILAATYSFPIWIRSRWLRRRFWILLEALGDAGLAVGTIAAALVSVDKGELWGVPWTALIVLGYGATAALKLLPKFVRGQ